MRNSCALVAIQAHVAFGRTTYAASRSRAASRRYNMQLRFTHDTAVPIPAVAQAQHALPQSARPSPTVAGGLQRAEYARHLA